MARVEIMWNRYLRAHGRKPSTREPASWYFTTDLYGNAQDNQVVIHGKLRDAAEKAAKQLGSTFVYVMEDKEKIMESKKVTKYTSLSKWQDAIDKLEGSYDEPKNKSWVAYDKDDKEIGYFHGSSYGNGELRENKDLIENLLKFVKGWQEKKINEVKAYVPSFDKDYKPRTPNEDNETEKMLKSLIDPIERVWDRIAGDIFDADPSRTRYSAANVVAMVLDANTLSLSGEREAEKTYRKLKAISGYSHRLIVNDLAELMPYDWYGNS